MDNKECLKLVPVQYHPWSRGRMNKLEKQPKLFVFQAWYYCNDASFFRCRNVRVTERVFIVYITSNRRCYERLSGQIFCSVSQVLCFWPPVREELSSRDSHQKSDPGLLGGRRIATFQFAKSVRMQRSVMLWWSYEYIFGHGSVYRIWIDWDYGGTEIVVESLLGLSKLWKRTAVRCWELKGDYRGIYWRV